MNQIWNKIPGFSRYEASNLGNLRSLNYKRTGKTKILKPAIRDGYYQTMLLGDDDKYHTKKVHWCVAIAFLGYRAEDQEVNHIDCDKTNNRIDNLEYISHSENVLHSYRNGLQTPLIGSTNGNSKLTEEQVIEIREYVKNFQGRYYGRKELAEKYGVSEHYIKTIVNRHKNIWYHV